MDQALSSRDELLAMVGQLLVLTAEQQKTISEQQSSISELQTRIKELEARLHKGGPKGMPGLKPESAKNSQPNQSRKKRPHGFARLRATPTEQMIHTVEECPKCGTQLKGGSVKYRREVIELPKPQPVQMTEHVFVERVCPLCRESVMPKDVLNDVVVGKQRLGVNLLSLIATLREELRLPVRVIRLYLDLFHGFSLSVGGIVGALGRVAEIGKPAAEEIRGRVRASPVVMADETGWRENGVNGYVWTFSTPTERYFLRRGRNKEVVDEVLGDEFSGVLVSDFYAAYNHYEGMHQRCWPHLLRDIHYLKEVFKDDESVQGWAKAVHDIYEEAIAFSEPSERKRLFAQQDFEDKLLRLCQPFLEDEKAPQRVLCERVNRHLSELFVFVGYPEVPADNNGAERSLRHLVTSRKISGGTRTKRGSDAKMVLATLFGTWRAQGLNPLTSCLQLLISPQL